MCHHAIEKVFQLAAATFSKKAGPESFTGNLEKLISLTNKLGGSDVGLDCCAALHSTNNSPSNTQDSPRGSRDRYSAPHRQAPVTYIPVTETHDISIGIFVIREGQHIPLHDHPDMHGIIKCLSGRLKITSYTKLPVTSLPTNLPDRMQESTKIQEKLRCGELFLAEKLDPAGYISPDDPCCVLKPDKANIHQIESVGGPAAFLDILAPPYNIDPPPGAADTQERDCHYFRVLSDSGPAPALRWLLLSPPPASFYCDTETYRGPDLASQTSS